MTTNSTNGYQPNQTFGSDYNALYFIIAQLIANIHTATLVQVQSCTNDGGVTPVGFVNVLPLVNQVSGNGTPTKHGVISKCSYFRQQGGTNAVILDPEVGDIGLMVFAEEDISSVIATQAQANPGSGRQFDMSDGLYVGLVSGKTPVQYVQFNEDGIVINSPSLVKLVAPDIQISSETLEIVATTSVTMTTPTFTLNGLMTATGNITAGQGGGSPIDLLTHKHTGVSVGGALTGGPTG